MTLTSLCSVVSLWSHAWWNLVNQGLLCEELLCGPFRLHFSLGLDVAPEKKLYLTHSSVLLHGSNDILECSSSVEAFDYVKRSKEKI